MSKKKDQNDRYWDAIKQKRLLDEYESFLKVEGKISSPHNAHIFATQKRNGGYTEMSEREIILLVAGSLPYMYD